MTDLYFLKIFFIDRIIPYTLMTLSIAFLILEIVAPKHIRFVFYDFSDRLFFKFIYRPISKIISLLKSLFVMLVSKTRDLLAISRKNRIAKSQKRAQQKAIRAEKKQQAAFIKKQNKEIKTKKKNAQKEEKRYVQTIKKEEKLQSKLVKKQEKLQTKLDNQRLKKEAAYKIKLLVAYKIKKLINKNKTK